MYFTVNSFYVGLITGTVVGISLTLYAIKNRVFRNKLSSVDDNSGHGDVQQNAEEYKMALLVRHDLKMGKGKVAAQCSHAIVHCYEEGLRLYPGKISLWESNNKLVDIFKVADEESMLKYHQLAALNGFNTHIVVDAGRTQVAPRSKTVMAIGPAKIEQIDLFTESLQVYT